MFINLLKRTRMDPKLIGQQWCKFLKEQKCFISNQATNNDESDLTNNPYYSKYANKLKNAKLEQEKQLNNLNKEEIMIKEKLNEFESKLEKKQNNSDQTTNKSTKLKELNDIIKLELIKDLSREDIKNLWYEHFKTKEHTIFGCLDAKNYDLIKENSKKYPVFIFPLPVNNIDNNEFNKNNYQFVLVQFQDNRSYFTPLAFYHTHKEDAPASLTINYYDELKDSKDIVLMEGEYDNKIFNLLEAQCLINQIQIFYSNNNKQKLLDNFTNNPTSFNYMDIVNEFEKTISIQ